MDDELKCVQLGPSSMEQFAENINPAVVRLGVLASKHLEKTKEAEELKRIIEVDSYEK